MKRNVLKIADTVKINNRYDMTASEWNELYQTAYNDSSKLAKTISIAFRFGYAMGMKSEQKR